MADDYTPSMANIRDCFVDYLCEPSSFYDVPDVEEAQERFDRAIAAHDAELRAEIVGTKVNREQIVAALLAPIHDYLCGCEGDTECIGDRRGFAEDCADALLALYPAAPTFQTDGESVIQYVRKVLADPKYGSNMAWVRANLHTDHLRSLLPAAPVRTVGSVEDERDDPRNWERPERVDKFKPSEDFDVEIGEIVSMVIVGEMDFQDACDNIARVAVLEFTPAPEREVVTVEQALVTLAQEMHDWAFHAGPDSAYFAAAWEKRIRDRAAGIEVGKS